MIAHYGRLLPGRRSERFRIDRLERRAGPRSSADGGSRRKSLSKSLVEIQPSPGVHREPCRGLPGLLQVRAKDFVTFLQVADGPRGRLAGGEIQLVSGRANEAHPAVDSKERDERSVR